MSNSINHGDIYTRFSHYNTNSNVNILNGAVIASGSHVRIGNITTGLVFRGSDVPSSNDENDIVIQTSKNIVSSKYGNNIVVNNGNTVIHNSSKVVPSSPDDDFEIAYESIPKNLEITQHTISKLMLTKYKKTNGTDIHIMNTVSNILFKFREIKNKTSNTDIKSYARIIKVTLNTFQIKYKKYFPTVQQNNIAITTASSSIRIDNRSNDEKSIQRYSEISYETNKDLLKCIFFKMCKKLKQAEQKAEIVNDGCKNTNKKITFEKYKCELEECYNYCCKASYTLTRFFEVMNKLEVVAK